MGSTEMETLLEPYYIKSKESLPYFNNELQKQNGRTFYIVTRIYEDKEFEQIFVLVSSHKDDIYQGTIASNPTGKIDFKYGSTVSIDKKDSYDWVIVSSDGTEEGNVIGKFIDLLQAGVVAFISKITPVEGLYSRFEVVSVLNPNTKQEIINIFSDATFTLIENEVKRLHGGKTAESENDVFVYTVAKFPSLEIINN